MTISISPNFQGKSVKLDQGQIELFERLNIKTQEIEAKNSRKTSLLSGFFCKKNKSRQLKGLYIYGKVGRGKSMLVMDFFRKVNVKKVHYHFNSFMSNVHKELHLARKSKSNTTI